MVVNEVLPDRDGVASTRERLGDDLAIRFARARTRCSTGPRTGSVDTPSPVMAGFASRSVDTSASEMAGFAFDSLRPAAAIHRDPGGFQGSR